MGKTVFCEGAVALVKPKRLAQAIGTAGSPINATIADVFVQPQQKKSQAERRRQHRQHLQRAQEVVDKNSCKSLAAQSPADIPAKPNLRERVAAVRAAAQAAAEKAAAEKAAAERAAVEEARVIAEEAAAAEFALRNRSSHLIASLENLPTKGRELWKCLEDCIQASIARHRPLSTQEFQKAVECVLGPCRFGCEKGARWTIEAPGNTFYASIRTEIEGEGESEGIHLLGQLKGAAIKVQRTFSKCPYLLGNCQAFLDACRNMSETSQKGCTNSTNDKGASCAECHLPLHQGLLGGRHHCRVIATFQCCAQWRSHCARFDPEKREILGQRCQECGKFGALSHWEIAHDSPYSANKRPHRSDLCEACSR